MAPGRDRVLIRRLPDCGRNRGRVLIADENTPFGGGTSSRRAGTRALPELHPGDRTAVGPTPNAERRTPNAERQTPNALEFHECAR